MSRPVDLQPPSGGGDSARLRMIRSLLPNLADWDSQICGLHRASQARDSVAKLLQLLLLSSLFAATRYSKDFKAADTIYR